MDTSAAVSSDRTWLAETFTTESSNQNTSINPSINQGPFHNSSAGFNSSLDNNFTTFLPYTQPGFSLGMLFITSTSTTNTDNISTTISTTINNNNDTLLSSLYTTGSDEGAYWCLNESSLPSDKEFYQFYSVAQFVTGLILYPCICVPGLAGNILTLLVLSHRNMRTSTNAFLSALAVADSIKLLNDLLYFLTIVLLRVDDVVGNRAYGYLYPYAHFVFSLSVCVSSWLTVTVAVERYVLVCHPTRARQLCSRGRAVAVCVAVFVVMTVLALPSALRYRTVHCTRRHTLTPMLQVELTELWRDDTFVLAYNWTQNLLRSVVPLVLLVVLNTCIIGALRKTRANKKNSSRHRVTMMMIIVILAFLIFITPDAILSTVFGLGYTESSYLVKGIREFTDTLLAINAATNFVIYCLFNRVFLDGCKSLFCQATTVTKKKWQTELDESQYKRLQSEALQARSEFNNSTYDSNLSEGVNGSSVGL